MTEIINSFGPTKAAVNAVIDDFASEPLVVALSQANVGGVGIVTATWPAFNAVFDSMAVHIAAGSLNINSAHVASPTTYYVYFDATSGTPVATASTTLPSINPAVDEYFITNVVRFVSTGGTATFLATKYPSQDGLYELTHNLKEDVLYNTPTWLSGCAPTIAAGGKISTSAGYVRFPGNEPRSQAIVTTGTICLEDESTFGVVGLDNIATYSGAGGAITATKFVKLLVGLKRNKGAILADPFLVVRSAKPAVEYATAALALADSEGVAATSFPGGYEGAVLPLCYVITQMGAGATSDFTQGGATPAGQLIDLRVSGFIKGAAGSVTDHSLLSNLNVPADHPGYVTIDGSRDLTGTWSVTKAITTTADVTADQFVSTIAIGTKPIDVTSTTVCTNLNADTVDAIHGTDLLKKDGTVALTGDWSIAKKITTTDILTGSQLASTIAIGTKPIDVTSTTVCTNLNADTVDGIHGTALLKADGTVALTGNMSVDALVTIDGVDLSAHAASATAHHALVSLSAAADGVLSLSTQLIGLDTQTASTALMGPAVGVGPAAPTFRAIARADVLTSEGVMTLANGANNNVTLTDGVDQYVVAGPTAAFGITGFSGGYAGRRIVVVNSAVAKNMTAYHQDGNSTAANRIICPGTMTDTATSSYGVMVFEYFATTARWMMVGIIA